MMRDNTLTFALMCFLLSWMLPADSMVIRRYNVSLPDPYRSIPLSMVKDAVDDMYEGCTKKMMKTVKEKYMKEESQGVFSKAWKNADKCTIKGLKNQKGDALEKDHIQAICVYTSNEIYQEFNSAVRADRAKYNTPDFKFHSLHFLLTATIQILQSVKENCNTAYRRTKDDFSGTVNQIIRFGYFASSSFKTNMTTFGKKTCFEIWTCFGAYLKNYPRMGDYEQEVLIPPYEMFKIIKITRHPQLKSKEGLNDCEVLYKLESIGVYSNLNCKAI